MQLEQADQRHSPPSISHVKIDCRRLLTLVVCRIIHNVMSGHSDAVQDSPITFEAFKLHLDSTGEKDSSLVDIVWPGALVNP